MTCDQIRNLFPDYRAGRLRAVEKALIDSHVSRCSDCSFFLHGRDRPLSTTTGSLPASRPDDVAARRTGSLPAVRPEDAPASRQTGSLPAVRPANRTTGSLPTVRPPETETPSDPGTNSQGKAPGPAVRPARWAAVQPDKPRTRKPNAPGSLRAPKEAPLKLRRGFKARLASFWIWPAAILGGVLLGLLGVYIFTQVNRPGTAPPLAVREGKPTYHDPLPDGGTISAEEAKNSVRTFLGNPDADIEADLQTNTDGPNKLQEYVVRAKKPTPSGKRDTFRVDVFTGEVIEAQLFTHELQNFVNTSRKVEAQEAFQAAEQFARERFFEFDKLTYQPGDSADEYTYLWQLQETVQVDNEPVPVLLPTHVTIQVDSVSGRVKLYTGQRQVVAVSKQPKVGKAKAIQIAKSGSNPPSDEDTRTIRLQIIFDDRNQQKLVWEIGPLQIDALTEQVTTPKS